MTYAPVRVPTARGFATAGVPSELQVELWEQHNAEALVALSCRPPEPTMFDAAELNVRLEQVDLARVRGTRHVVERSAHLVKTRPADAIAVYATLRGEAVFEQDGRRQLLRPGQLLVCDADRPFLRGFGNGLEELAVKVRRSAFFVLTGLPSIRTPIVLDVGPRQDLHGRALTRLVGRAVRAEDPVPADEAAILELVSVIATGGRIGLPVAHRAAARAFIEENLADPTLSAADVATAIGISERHLSRIFAAAGTSVPRYILSRRLDSAYAMLTGTGTEQVRAADVAARCGFTSTAYFSHTFRNRFGVTTREVRQRG